MSPRLTLIAAMDQHRGIGIRNTLPWKLPEDLAFFKKTTLGHPILMGRKTHESIGRALPGRRNMVISRNAAYAAPGVEVFASVESALAAAQVEHVFLIGGAELYRHALHLADALVLTEIDHSFEVDAWFPEFDRAQFQVQWEETHGATPERPWGFRFVRYQRIASAPV